MTNFGLAKPIRRREASETDELKARIAGALAALDDALDDEERDETVDEGQAAGRRDARRVSSSKRA